MVWYQRFGALEPRSWRPGSVPRPCRGSAAAGPTSNARETIGGDDQQMMAVDFVDVPDFAAIEQMQIGEFGLEEGVSSFDHSGCRGYKSAL